MNQRLRLIRCMIVAVLSVEIILVTGCGVGRHEVEMASEPGYYGGDYKESSPPETGPPKSHAWAYLDEFGEEEIGYATYSYILIGRTGDADENHKSVMLFFELMEEIMDTTMSSSEIPEHVLKSLFNLFLIMGDSEEANFELSKSLIAALQLSVPGKFKGAGPFIVTVVEPIRFAQSDAEIDILYVDVSKLHPNAIPELVRRYKSRIQDESLDGVEKLKHFKASFLSFLLDADNAIDLAKLKVAAILPK